MSSVSLGYRYRWNFCGSEFSSREENVRQQEKEIEEKMQMLEEKQSQQQTLVYEQKAQQAKLEQARNDDLHGH